MYSTHNEGQSDVADRFIRTLKNTIYEYMTSLSNNTCIEKMKPVYVKSNTYIDSNKEINDKDPKFKSSDIVRISKHENTFVKGYTPNLSEEVSVIKKDKNNVP